MRFYTRQHRHYCGVDLHARTMYVCVLDRDGNVLVSKDIPSAPEPFLELIAPYREDLAVAAECMFTWYWLADLCAREGLVFVLGHALYMRAIHGGKAKNDRIDAHKIAGLLRGGMLPQAYVYPQAMRATRDLMRRRNYLMRQRAELLAHITNTNHQYNLPALGVRPARPAERSGLLEHFAEPQVRRSVAVDLSFVEHYDRGCRPWNGTWNPTPRRTTRWRWRSCARSTAWARCWGSPSSTRSRTLVALPACSSSCPMGAW